VLGEEGVLFRHHRVDGMPEFVGHRGDIVGFALVVEQHPWGQVRTECGTERAAHFALADFAVNMALIENTLSHTGKPGIKTLKSLESQVSGFLEGVALIRLSQRSVNIVTAQFFHAQLLSFQAEIAMEDTNILARNLEQGVDHLVRQVVDGVAYGNRAGKPTQGDIFVLPIANDVLVYLPQDRRVLTIDAVQLLVRPGAQVGVSGAHQRHELAAGQFFHLAIDFNFEDIAVGD